MQDTADIVPVFLIDRDFGVPGFAHFGNYLMQRSVNGQEKDIGAGRHDVFQGFVAEVKYLLDKLRFKMIQGTFTQRLSGQDPNHIFGNDVAAGTFFADNQGDKPIGDIAHN